MAVAGTSFSVLLISCAVLAGGEPSASARPAGRWQKLPPLPGRSDYVHDIALEPGNVLWAMAGTSVAYWDGQQFRRPEGAELNSGQYLTKFYGGPDRGLYITQRGTEEHQGKIYRLSDGRAEYVTDFYYEVAHDYPGLYVSRSGRLFNWGKDFIAFYTGKAWEKAEAALDHNRVHVFDTGERVYFYCSDKLYCIDRNNKSSAAEVPIRLGNERAGMKAALWGRDRAIALEYAAKGVHLIDLANGKLGDAAALNRALGNRSVYDLFRARDGSVWVMAYDDELKSYLFFRISPEGEVSRIDKTAGYAWDNHQIIHNPQIVLHATDGALWFGMLHGGVVYYKDGQTYQFDGSEGLDLSSCLHLLEGAKGKIYATSSLGIYEFDPRGVEMLEGPTAARKPIILDQVAWKHVPPQYHGLARAWRIGNTIAFTTTRNDRTVTILDLSTGAVRSELKTGQDARDTWGAPGRKSGEMLLSSPGKIVVVDLSGGKILQHTAYKLDPRIPPVPVGDDYLVASGYRGARLVRIDRSGKELWECGLPGYVQAPLAVGGSIAVVQTRQGSYGGQATTGVDVNTGKRLWSETVDAYGYGAAFGDDAAFVVEADMWLSPKATEGWLICREPATGKRRWHFRLDGTISHAPLVDGKTGRVFAAFDRGEVVCLKGADGSLVWKAQLPENPYAAVNPSNDPAWSCLARQGDRLMVLDRNRVLHFLDVEDGRFIASVALTAAFVSENKYMRPADVLAMPWVEGDNLIVATTQGVAAYRLGRED
jgi:outer membrane protein assembly factor BamB